MITWVMKIPTTSILGQPRVSLSRNQTKPKAWQSLELLPGIEIVDRALWFGTPASEPKLTNPYEVHESISVLKDEKATGPNCITKRALKHLPSEQYPWSSG